MTRLRFRYTKVGKIRFIGHRDLARLWERALRRSALPVASTEGFSPRPKVHFGLALSTGFESLAEFIDVDLDDNDGGSEVVAAVTCDLSALADNLSALLPQGIDVEAAAIVERGPSLQASVGLCQWEIAIEGFDKGTLDDAVAKLLMSPSLVVQRERKSKITTVDIRPALERIDVIGPADVPGWDVGSTLTAQLQTSSPGFKVAELIDHLVDQPTDVRVRRTHQWILGDGVRREPLPAFAPAHTEVCAS